MNRAAIALLAMVLASGAQAKTIEEHLSSMVEAPFEQHFAPAENLESIDAALIVDAQSSIDIAAYILSDWTLQDNLVAAAKRGVAIRLVLDASEYRFHGPMRFLELFRLAGGNVRLSQGPALMHLKSYCIDGNILRFGAANLSHSGLTEQNNDLNITRGPNVCDKFEATFERIWDGLP